MGMTWSILGDSAIGTSHRTRNTPCQDAFRFCTFGPLAEWLLIAVADGAGSASHSEIGATLVCDEFVQMVETISLDVLFTRDGMLELFTAIRNRVVAEAARHAVRPRELACTVLLALVGPDSAAFAQLGDGAIVLGNGTDYRTVFWPEPTEYANATDFLTDDRFADAFHFTTTTETINELAVFTDGLQRLALDFTERTPHPAFFRPFFRRLQSEPDAEALFEPFRLFLDSTSVNAKTDDDKTLVLAVRRS